MWYDLGQRFYICGPRRLPHDIDCMFFYDHYESECTCNRALWFWSH
jgi:hypothetical protein